MDILFDAKQLAEYIRNLEDFKIYSKTTQSAPNHIGAIIVDCVLQAGLNYKSVVVPRVSFILKNYSNYNTLSRFQNLLLDKGAENVMKWKHHEKIERLQKLMNLLFENGIEYESQLRYWLQEPRNEQKLLEIKGVGFKTVDYLKGLLDIDSVAVDRHIYSFVEEAGISNNDYKEVRYIVERAADLLGLSRSILDFSIWNYKSNFENIPTKITNHQYNLFQQISNPLDQGESL